MCSHFNTTRSSASLERGSGRWGPQSPHGVELGGVSLHHPGRSFSIDGPAILSRTWWEPEVQELRLSQAGLRDSTGGK